MISVCFFHVELLQTIDELKERRLAPVCCELKNGSYFLCSAEGGTMAQLSPEAPQPKPAVAGETTELCIVCIIL